jgi:hypothetical protein
LWPPRTWTWPHFQSLINWRLLRSPMPSNLALDISNQCLNIQLCWFVSSVPSLRFLLQRCAQWWC